MNLGFPEMLFLFLLALIIFGPKKLPEIGRQVGKALSEFKRASNEFKSQIESEMRQIEIDETVRKEKESIAKALESPAGTVRTAAEDAKKPEPESEPAKAVEAEYPNLYRDDPYPPAEKPAEAPAKAEDIKGTDA
jgi:sec-independent protein translocase protein TatB